ncbi:HAMP domain-containing histidine kinase [Acidaminobacter sp. JC074]|uniref:sensor histidine kinase n=1 Tax=Acidaminobacter sp. JC074 TaxID=2530199 RepID=UPI001F0F9A36|nr:HAMP domain-containing sensor histidine kinase [Acidaminobacter sp. JC074]MCH4890999.1 HAMP domain-containing histidine kinase [Acidaminobacter sp. JC074]
MDDKIKDLENEVERLKKMLTAVRHSYLDRERLALLGELVPGITHEINTPLGVAVSAASFIDVQNQKVLNLFEEGKLKKSDLEQYFSNVNESTEILNQNLHRAAKLIGDFKEISSYQSNGIKIDFNLCDYIEKIVKTLKHEYKRAGHKIVVACHDVRIYSYPGIYSQVITNLVMNSIIHGFKDQTEGSITISVNKTDYLTITYTDDGVGIEENALKQIFEPYYTTKRDDGGTGLGLSIVNQLVVERLNGTIECFRNEESGVKFIIRVPLSEVEKR